ncbi:hypothetical protein CANINC_001499 [Pichia inconspicua]|uniref:DHHA2 domain-containing protein n=1 Tax=Pichia inconspicua TaxID=52247 RepID=A0A4T0X4U6_9ASCO|nr:hypothetical protein CANINC_001499 [[Candida] inconspicua]
MRIVEFIKHAKARLATTPAICIGNSGGDLDSVVSCVAYAWLQSLNGGSDVTPIVSFPRDELVLRKDVELVLHKAGINTSDLIFIDDLNLEKKYQIHLVDHNVIDGPEKGEVVSIIDHHDDAGEYLNANPRIVERSGSCVSLVLRELLDNHGSDMTDAERKFLASPILVDTRGFTARVEEVDRCAAQAVSLIDPVTISLYTEELQTAKEDVSGLTSRDLLRKDYKQWTVCEGKVLGISSIMGRVGPVLTAIPDWAEEKGLTILLVMAAYSDENDTFCRELAVYGEFPIDEVISALKLEKQPIAHPVEGVTVYTQHATACSRKQVAPLVLKALQNVSV